MAESLTKLLEKKRFLSSSSEESSPSPNRKQKDAKKLRSANITSEESFDQEESDKMSSQCKHCDTKLDSIISKLEMLDAIEKSVKALQETLGKMDARILSLENAQATTNRDINDLKDSLSFTQDQQTKTATSLESLKDQTNRNLAELTKKNDELEGKLRELESQNLYLNAYSRRENIKFENIPEETSHNRHEDTEEVLRNFLETNLGYEQARDVEIQRVHRLKTKNADAKPKPIIARFLRYKDCERILSLGHRLKDTGYRMYQDLPYGIVERRRKLMDVFKTAKKNKIPAVFSKSQPDKLYVRGKLWPVGRSLDLASNI